MAIGKNGSISNTPNENNEKVRKLAFNFGIALILLGAILFSQAVSQVVISEVRYVISGGGESEFEVSLNDVDETKRVEDKIFLSPTFGLSIPKINANANVIANVNPFDINEYESALALGVAHAKTTSLPGEYGNVFLFAHSAVNFYENSKYNVYFYLLPKLEKGDDIYVSYKNKVYEYKVEEVKIVNKNEVKYLSSYKDYNTLTLMTCWPAGMDVNRVIVTASQVSK